MPDNWNRVLGGKPADLRDLHAVADELLRKADGRKVWLFFGEMGSGKTTLIKSICSNLGVSAGMGSPTFSIINEYQGAGDSPVFHFDFYRLKKEEEAFDMGVEEYFDSGSYCFVEWPEKIESLLPLHYLSIRIQVDSPSSRVIDYSLA